MSLLSQPGHVFIVPGDVTQLRADVVVYSTSTALLGGGHLHGAFAARFPWFAEAYTRAIPRMRSGNVGCAVGAAFCIEPPNKQGPAIVVVASTIDGRFGTTTKERLSRDEIAERAIQGAMAAAKEYLEKNPGSTRRLIALPTLRMGQGGDRNHRLRSARIQVRATLECLKNIPGTDAAFVPFISDNHQMFLQARRDVLGGQPPCPLLEGANSERLRRLVGEIRAGRCVLFVGSGLSWQLPGWKGLLDALAADLGRPAPATFDLKSALDLAEDFLWERGGGRLAEQIRKRYADYDKQQVRPTVPHYLLLTLPLRLVITTNYDDLLERTLTALRRHHRLVLRDRDVIHTGAPEPLCVVKLHGDPKADEGRGIVLARGQYEAFRVQHPGLALLLAGSLLNQTFLFIGYSRVDPNFSEIFDEVASLYEGASWQAYATSVDPPTPPQPQRSQLEVLQMPAEDTSTRIHELALFLDWLTDAVTLGCEGALETQQEGSADELPPGLFLAPDMPLNNTGNAATLRRVLLDQVATLVESSCDSAFRLNIGPKAARHLARVLRFLVEQGWRPEETIGQTSAVRLSRIWERLAECVSDRVERGQCLAAAWRFAEQHDDVQRLGALLGHLEP